MSGISQTHPRPTIAPVSTGGFEATCPCGWSERERKRKAMDQAVLNHVKKAVGAKRRFFAT